jgi:capsular polysaccharide biosynthesis protein
VAGTFFHGYPFASAIASALGLTPNDFVFFDRPVRIRKLIVPRPSFQQQAFAHRVYGELCRRAGRALLGDAPVRPDPRPVWLSKTRLSAGVRRWNNEGEVEGVLEKFGVEIAYPEQMTFQEQVRLFASRSVICGTAGSAFHTSIFAPNRGRRVLIHPAPVINSNFRLFDALSGDEAVHVHVPAAESRHHPPGYPFMATVTTPHALELAEAIAALLPPRSEWVRPPRTPAGWVFRKARRLLRGGD